MFNSINPAIIESIGLVVSIVLIILLIRRGWKMFLVLSIAILVLALTNGNAFYDNLNLLYRSVTSFTAFNLVAMITAILLLGNLHQKVGAMDQTVKSLSNLIRDPRALIMIFPAVISLFSTGPGGAVISAPMVEKSGEQLKMAPTEMAIYNLIYRHLIVLVTPFNPAMILTAGITGLAIATIIGFTFPVILVVFIISSLIMIKTHPLPTKEKKEAGEKNQRRQELIRLLIATSPYTVSITLGLVFGLFFPIALLIGIVICFFINLPEEGRKDALKERSRGFFSDFNWNVALSTLAVVVFKDFMTEAESFHQAVQYLISHGLPIILVVAVIPFIIGFVTGNNTASLGIALPLLIPFLSPDLLSVRYLGVAYVCSYAGYLGSPVHLCTFLTNEYFKTPLFSVIKKANAYGFLLLCVAVIFSFFY